MNSTELPIVVAPLPTTNSTPLTPVTVDAALVQSAEAAQGNFVAMLAQLLGDGAAAVTPIAGAMQAVQTQLDVDGDGTEPALRDAADLTDTEAPNPLLANWLPTLSTHIVVTGAPTATPSSGSASASNPVLTNLLQSTIQQRDAMTRIALPASAESANAGAQLELSSTAQLAHADEAQAVVDFKAALATIVKVEPVKMQAAAEVTLTNEATPTTGLSTTTTPTETKAQPLIEARVGTPAWSNEVATRVAFLNERGVQTASLRLTPEHLGPMEVQISIQDDRATVWFGASHAETRAALENALPRLRELLQSQGLTLADAGVFKEPPREHARTYQTHANGGATSDGEKTVVTINGRSVLIDAYA